MLVWPNEEAVRVVRSRFQGSRGAISLLRGAGLAARVKRAKTAKPETTGEGGGGREGSRMSSGSII